MKLIVIAPGLYLTTGEAKVGQVIEIDGDEVPTLYLGKVRQADEALEVATPQPEPLTDSERDELEALRVFKADAEQHADELDALRAYKVNVEKQRKEYLLDQIEKLSSKRPNGNTSLESLESQFAALDKGD